MACATAANAPIPLASIQRWSRTWVVTARCSRAIDRARSASSGGPMSRAGVFCRSRARLTASVTAVARFTAGPVAAHDRERLQRFGPILGSLGAVPIEAIGRGRHALDHVPAGLGQRRTGTCRRRTRVCVPGPRAPTAPPRRPPVGPGRRRRRPPGRGRPPPPAAPARPQPSVCSTVTWPRPPRISPAATSAAMRPPRARSSASTAPETCTGLVTATASMSPGVDSSGVRVAEIRMSPRCREQSAVHPNGTTA